MYRLTGNDAKSLMEAYQAVYTPQELTEEQVWEEVENWVNSLVDEGYDLSEYTWEEVYEAYNYIQETQLNENPVSALTGMATRAISPIIVGGAAKFLQNLKGGRPKQEPVDYGQMSPGSFASSKDKPAPKPAWEKPSTTPSGSSTRLPSPAQPPAPKPPAPKPPAPKPPAPKPPAPKPPAPKPPAQPPEPPAKPPASSKPAASLGLRKAAKGVVSTVGRAATSGPGKTTLKYGLGVPVVGGLATGAAIDVKRALTGKSSATQRLSGALQGGAGNVLKGIASIGAATPGVKTTGTPQEIQQTGEYLKKAGKDTQKKVDVKRYVELNQSADLLDIVKNYLIDNKYSNDEESALSIIENMSDEWIENILEAPELGSVGPQGKIYTGPKFGYQSWQTASSKRLLPSEVLGSEPPRKAAAAPAPKPEPQRGSTNAQGKIYTGPKFGYQSWQTASSKRLLPSEVLGSEPPRKAAATQTRPALAPAATQTRPAPAPAPAPAATQTRPPTAPPKLSPSKPAQTGDRTKDLTTWALSNKSMINKVGTKAQKEILSKAQAGETMPAPRPLKASLKDSYEYDAYDLVLEYLLSQGHTDTLEEAHYVMMEMDAETIGSICEAAAGQSNKQIETGIKTTYKAQQGTLPNQASRGLNRLPSDERAAKTKRMQGRLKTRRDDLFGERNRREDESREKLKKMLGL